LQEEEEERSKKWKNFLERCSGAAGSAEIPAFDTMAENASVQLPEETSNCQKEESDEDKNGEFDASELEKETSESSKKETSEYKVEIWAEPNASLSAIEHLMSFRVKKKKTSSSEGHNVGISASRLASAEEGPSPKEENSDKEFYVMERLDANQEAPSDEGSGGPSGKGIGTTSMVPQEPFFPWKEELECLVHGGVPRALRGEVKSVLCN